MKMIILNSLDKRAVLVGGAHKEEGQLDHQNYLELDSLSLFHFIFPLLLYFYIRGSKNRNQM
jgi:hypothetical protein